MSKKLFKISILLIILATILLIVGMFVPFKVTETDWLGNTTITTDTVSNNLISGINLFDLHKIAKIAVIGDSSLKPFLTSINTALAGFWIMMVGIVCVVIGIILKAIEK